MTNEIIGKIILTFISILTVVGMGSTLYSLLYEQDIIVAQKKKPDRFYAHKQDIFDTRIETILNDDAFDINYLSDSNSVILD